MSPTSFEAVTMVAPEFIAYTAAAISAGALAMRKFMQGPLHDEGFRNFATPNIDALEAVIAVCESNGLAPSREITDEKAVRALMDDNMTVFNVTREDAWNAMGRPTAAPMLRVKDPEAAAENAASTFEQRGFTAELNRAIQDQTPGKIVFVRTDALACGMIGFREHVTKMGKRPPKWNPNKKLGFSRPQEA